MKNKISVSFKLMAVIVFSSLLFTQAKAQLGGGACTAAWNYQTGTAGGCTAYFADLSTGTNSTTPYVWDFGDGTSGTQQNPTHTYSASGTFSVCLTISVKNTNGPNCYDTLCNTVTVHCNSPSTGVGSLEKTNILLSVNNPVFASADIRYSLPVNGTVELTLFDMLGNRISILENGTKNAGTHSYSLSTGSFSKGIYFLRLNFNDTNVTKKIIIAG